MPNKTWLSCVSFGASAVPSLLLLISLAIFVYSQLLVKADSQLITAEEILAATNTVRLSAGVPALRLDKKLSQAAAQRAADMANKKYFAHTSPDGIEPWYWFAQNNYSYSRAGENLALNFKNAEALVTAWLKSPEHKKNILNPFFQDIGVRTQSFVSDGTTYTVVVELYGAPKTISMR